MWRGEARIGVEVVAARVGAAICVGVEVGMGTCKSRSREQGQVSVGVYMLAGRPRRGPGCRAEMPGWSRLS